MTEYPYILFNKSPEQLRQLGACGGRAYGRNQRARRALVATQPEAVPPPALPQQTTAEAIHLLDALRVSDKRHGIHGERPIRRHVRVPQGAGNSVGHDCRSRRRMVGH